MALDLRRLVENPNIPDELCRIIERMTAKDPKERYTQCDKLFE